MIITNAIARYCMMGRNNKAKANKQFQLLGKEVHEAIGDQLDRDLWEALERVSFSDTEWECISEIKRIYSEKGCTDWLAQLEVTLDPIKDAFRRLKTAKRANGRKELFSEASGRVSARYDQFRGYIGGFPDQESIKSDYQRPEWKRRAAQIMRRDRWRCRLCHAKYGEAILQVHHARYIQGRHCWEYESFDLITLCESCHARIHGK